MPNLDDTPLFFIRKDISGGQNNRVHGSNIGENQATLLYNIDLSVPYQTSKRAGLTAVDTLSSGPATGLLGFEPDGGTNQLVTTYGSNLATWPATGTFTNRKTDFTSGLATKMIKALESGENDVVIVSNGTDNMFRMNQSFTFSDLGDTNTSPPKSKVMTFYRNRLWVVKNNQLYWSDAFPADYGLAFDRTTNAYRMPIGTERAVLGIRDLGLVVMGQDQIWAINPSATPAATDLPEKLLDIGCVAGETACQVGDDIYFLAADGVRGLFRTIQDKVQLESDYPLSYVLKTEYDNLAWGSITKACAVYFDNKYFVAVPTSASTYNNQVWVYFPASKGWMVITGWNVSAWSTLHVNGKLQLYATDAVTGKVYQAWKGFSDDGVAINYQEEGRKENLGQPLVTKTGGYAKIQALSSGGYTLNVYASVDDQAYQLLGTMSLAGSAPALPVVLPFDLADVEIIEGVFSLDSLGPWRQIRLKIQHNELNGSDDIIIYDRSLTTYADPFQSV
jgi:hypothetical protein